MDPWTQILDLLSQVVTPLWATLLQYIPLLLLGLIILTAYALVRMWLHNGARNRVTGAATVARGAGAGWRAPAQRIAVAVRGTHRPAAHLLLPRHRRWRRGLPQHPPGAHRHRHRRGRCHRLVSGRQPGVRPARGARSRPAAGRGGQGGARARCHARRHPPAGQQRLAVPGAHRPVLHLPGPGPWPAAHRRGRGDGRRVRRSAGTSTPTGSSCRSRPGMYRSP